MKEQILKSPFVKKEFLDLVNHISDTTEEEFDNFSISDSSIVNIGSREIVDYRPSISIDSIVIKENNITSINFDSLHFFQIQNLVKELKYKSAKIKKSDVCVNLTLPASYEDYQKSLTKKNRHELKRKKRKFANEIISSELKDSNNKDIFNIFISQHRQSKGEKGEVRTKKLETDFKNLLE